MSVASLSKFTVPLATNQSAATQGMLMPKLKYRFRVTFTNFGVGGGTEEMTKQVISAARPNVSFANQVIEVYNSKVNYAGKHTWNTMAISLRDDATGNVSFKVAQQLQKQFDFFEQSSAASAADYKFQMQVEILDGGNGADGTGNVLETWECYGCYLETVNYQTLGYADQGPVQIDLTIRPDNCLQKPDGSGLGVDVVRTLGTMASAQSTV
jgi:hypothetical protein